MSWKCWAASGHRTVSSRGQGFSPFLLDSWILYFTSKRKLDLQKKTARGRQGGVFWAEQQEDPDKWSTVDFETERWKHYSMFKHFLLIHFSSFWVLYRNGSTLEIQPGHAKIKTQDKHKIRPKKKNWRKHNTIRQHHFSTKTVKKSNKLIL